MCQQTRPSLVLTPSPPLHQCWIIVNWISESLFRWILIKIHFSNEKVNKFVVCKQHMVCRMVTILYGTQYLKKVFIWLSSLAPSQLYMICQANASACCFSNKLFSIHVLVFITVLWQQHFVGRHHVSINNSTRTTHVALVYQIDDLVQDCSNSSALAMELLQSCTKPSK